MSREIAVNTSQLQKEVDTMENALKLLKTRIDEAYQEVNELDKLWDGPDNKAFQESFRRDQAKMTEIYEALKSLVASMSMSRVEYEKCEADVKSIVDNIKI
ncbi:MAG: WXG100 family type VII secretion target [Lachnospiraceae bacterium]|nr:WXG100 family type VII secretion target [Lachnospiraceae bacterium]